MSVYENRHRMVRTTRRGLLRAGGVAAVGGVALRTASPAAAAPPGTVSSPDGRVTARLEVRDGSLVWRAWYDGSPVLRPSGLGLRLADGRMVGDQVRLLHEDRDSEDGVWYPVAGTQARIPEDHTELIWTCDDAAGARFVVNLRAYDAGLAVRYRLLSVDGSAIARIADERTEFRLRNGVRVWVNRAESETVPMSPGAIPSSGGRDSGRLSDHPLTASFVEGDVACITESAVEHYPRMLLESITDDPDAVVTHLARHAQQGQDASEATSSSVDLPFSTPWRVVVVGSHPAELVDHSVLPVTLGRPSLVEDTSWIRPGTAIRDVTLSTTGGVACVDFAAERGMSYVLYDAGWYGPETDPTADATTVTPDPARTSGIPGWDGLDLQHVIDYGRSHGIGVLLYVNKRALDRQLDEILPLYEQWGAAGIKMGFIAQGRQQDNDWIFSAIRRAAQHHLVIDTHDDVRPMGLQRTLPNWLTMEGVRGNEHMPTARNNLTLPFTRNIGGPMDATFCFNVSNMLTSDAHQLAAAVVFVSGLASLYWYGRPRDFTNHPETAGWQDLPTTWDESRTLSGAIGEHVLVARRKGDEWFIASMTNEQPRILRANLGFLGPGPWQGELYQDAQVDAAPKDTPVRVEQITLGTPRTVTLQLGPSGGALLRLRRA